MQKDVLKRLNRLLSEEEIAIGTLRKTNAAKQLADSRQQLLASHQARLDNLDKSRLDDDEKQLVEARKSAVQAAGRLYIERQARTLGVAAPEQA